MSKSCTGPSRIHLKIARMILQISCNSSCKWWPAIQMDALEGLHVVSDMVNYIKHPVSTMIFLKRSFKKL